jgi:hypothetical protein
VWRLSQSQEGGFCKSDNGGVLNMKFPCLLKNVQSLSLMPLSERIRTLTDQKYRVFGSNGDSSSWLGCGNPRRS